MRAGASRARSHARARTRCPRASRAVDEALHAAAQAAGQYVEGRDADRAVPNAPQGVNVRDLEQVFDAGAEVTPEVLKAKRLIRTTRIDVKILGQGDLTKITVSPTASRSRREKIEGAGGSVASCASRRSASASGTRRRPPVEAESGRRTPRSRRRLRLKTPSRARRARRARRGVAVLSWLTNAWRVPELRRRRLLFTAMIIALYRLGSWVPAPGVDSGQIKNYFSTQGGTVLGLLNLFSAGRSRSSRSSRWGSCRTSRRRSSSSC